jgi:hypothetical protein
MEKDDKAASPHPSPPNFDSTPETQLNGKETSLDDPTNTPIDEEHEYVTGYKLFVVIGASTVAGFLMLLDTSIVATVGLEYSPNTIFISADSDRLFLESPATSIPSGTLAGMELPTNWPG